MAIGNVSVHGQGVRVTANPQLSLEFRPASARVKNMTDQTITPTVYFPLPNPQAGTPNLDTIIATFTGGDVTVTNVALYNGEKTVLNAPIDENSNFTYDIPRGPTAQYTNKGLSVGLTLSIPGRKYIDFKSVTISTSGS